MRRLFFLFVFMLAVVAIGSHPVSAQNEQPLEPLPEFLQEDALPDAPESPVTQDSITAPPEQNRGPDYSDIPYEFIQEATAFGEDCKNNRRMVLYYDCRCMAVEYLDRRIELGEDAPPSQVAQGIGPECADGTGIAGSLYEGCVSNYVQVPVGLDVDDFCACYGNTYAKIYEDIGVVVRSPLHVKLMQRARLNCSNPDLGRRLYGTDLSR